MTVKTMQTAEVKDLLEKVAGIQHGRWKRAGEKPSFTVSCTTCFSSSRTWTSRRMSSGRPCTTSTSWARNGEAALLAPGLGMDKYLDIRLDAEDEQAGLDGGTPRTIEGPLYVAGAPESQAFARMDDGTDEAAETMILTGQVTDDQGQPLANAVVDIWHADTKGAYSYFDQSQSEYNLRRRIVTDENGRYTARSINSVRLRLPA